MAQEAELTTTPQPLADHVDARPIADVVRDHPTVVIRGDPGSGKSVSCRYLTHQACLEWLSATPHEAGRYPVPVLIELHRYRNQADEDAWDSSPTDPFGDAPGA